MPDPTKKSRKKCSDGRRRGLGRREGRNRLKQIGTLQGSLTEGEKFSTVDLLVLTRYDNLIFLLKMLCIFKTRYHNKEVKRTQPFPSVRIPWTFYVNNSAALNGFLNFSLSPLPNVLK